MSPCGQVWSGKVFDADGQYLGVKASEFAVIALQLPELLEAIASPESPVEHQHDILVSAIRLKTDQLADGGAVGQGKQGSRIFRRFRRRCRSRHWCCGWLRCCRRRGRRDWSGRWLRSCAGLRFGCWSRLWLKRRRWFRFCGGRRCCGESWLRRIRGRWSRVRRPGRRRHGRVRRVWRYGGLRLRRRDGSPRRDGKRRWYIGGCGHHLRLTGRGRDRWPGAFLSARHQGNQNNADNCQRNQPDSRRHADVCSVVQCESPSANMPAGFKVVPFYYGEAGRADSPALQARQRTGCPPL